MKRIADSGGGGRAAGGRLGRSRGRRAREDAEGRDGHRLGGLNDRGFNHLAYVGLQQAQTRPRDHVPGRRVALVEPTTSRTSRRSRGRDYDLVVGVGYTEIGAMGAVAKRFPNTRFAIVDVANGDLAGKPKNVLGLLFREEQVGYLAGYLAGLEAKRQPGKDVVSSVAGEKQPPVDRFIAGYQAGAQEGRSGGQGAQRVLAGLQRPGEVQGDRAEPDRRRVGRRLRRSPAAAASAHSMRRRARTSGGSASTPTSRSSVRTILTSATKKVDRAVFLAMQAVQQGRFNGGNAVYGLGEGGVGARQDQPEGAEVARSRRSSGSASS